MNKPDDAPISPGDIEQHVACIAATLDELSTSEVDIGRLAEVAERFQLLRRQYQAHRRSLDKHLPRLSQLREQFDALLDSRLPEVVDRYHHVVEQIRQAESEKAFLREFLVRKAGPGPRESLSGTIAEVVIRSSESRVLPAMGTEPRTQLERLIHEAGQWEEVSQLSRTRLQRALKEARFAPAQQQSIAQLCPLTVVHQVSARLRQQ